MMTAAMKREAHPRGRALPSSFDRGVAIPAAGLALAIVFALASMTAAAQAPRASGAATTSPASAKPQARPPAPAREEGVRWQALTPAQREVLAPLEHDWPTIESPRKQKWLALAGRFRNLPAEERARISARMVEWAKLTPVERGQARLRFEEARQVPAPDRTARWQAYQALPVEQRQQFAARAASAAFGAREVPARTAKIARDSKEAKFNVVPSPALTQPPKQVAPTLVQAGPGATTTPITRRPMPPAHQQTGMPKIAATPEFVNRSTLLPRRGPQAAAVATASAVAPAAPVAAPARPVVAASAPQ
jgi:hypothetical protein